MPTARQELATAVLNGKIYVIGGYDENERSTAAVEVYNPQTDRWSSAAPIPVAANHNAAAVAAGRLYSINISSMSVYDPVTDSWSSVASTHSAHGQTPAVGVFEDKIYIAGGLAAASSRELEVYDPASNTWTVRAPMSVARNHTAGAFIDGRFYVVGGRGTSEAPTALEVYDPQSNTWHSLAPMPTGRSGIAAAAVNGELFVFGGEIPTIHGEVEAYDPATNTWRRLPDMPNPRHGIWASAIGSRIYLPGGASQQGFGASSVNEVFAVDVRASFANISTRGRVATGDEVMIGGFITTGDKPKRVLTRILGPSLPVDGALGDPLLELHDSTGKLSARNDNWPDAPNAQETIDTAIAPVDDREAAIVSSLGSGSHTVVARGVGETTGVALVEAYDLEAAPDNELANISTRAAVGGGENVLIGGLILRGQQPRRVLFRAIGPSLPLDQALGDPSMQLRDSNGSLVAENDNWRSSQEAEIAATTIAPANELESAILQTLSAGNYTAIVSGVNNAAGIALIEAYALP